MANAMQAGRVAALLAILVAATLAGCLGSKDSSEQDGSAVPNPQAGSSSTDPGSMTSGPGSTIPTVPAQGLFLTNCVAWDAFRNYPPGLAPGIRPKGWGPNMEDPVVAVSLFGFRCERMALNRFERGPFYLLLDTHGNAAVPADCASNQSGVTPLRILQNLVVNDAEVASYLETTYGVPVWTAAFTESDRDLGASALRTWTWAAESQAPSTMTIPDSKQAGNIPTLYERLFWPRGEGIAALELILDEEGPATNLAANGTIQPPLLLAQDTGGTFAGQGDWRTNVQGAGKFTIYNDLFCKEPAT